MAHRAWTHDELMLAMNLYCQLSFGKLHARNREVVELAATIGRTPASVAMKLCNLASLDPAHQERGIRGLSKVSAADRAIWDEFHADWNRLAVESEALRDEIRTGAGAPPTDEEFADNESSTATLEFAGETESVRQQKVRLAQRFFRRAVISSYDSRCCVSRIGIRSLLVASHIIPWAHCQELRANPRNGICLSRLHDAAFDRGLITFDADYRLVLSTELRGETTNAVLAASFQAFEAQTIQLPNKFRPDPGFLKLHRETIFHS